MTLQEFTERTGFYPDDALYKTIEAYCSGDMDAFCKAYKENEDGLAERIQRETNAALDRDREPEWKLVIGYGSKIDQDEYDELLELCTGMDGEAHYMGEAEAKQLVAEEFGFSPDKIEIVDTVHDYEMNKNDELREAAEYKRPPLYDSSSYNYIRFDVRCVAAVRHYEMIDGELEEYHC